MRVAGIQRTHLLHTPARYDTLRKVPLVILLHGHGESAANFDKYTGMSDNADQRGRHRRLPTLGGPEADGPDRTHPKSTTRRRPRPTLACVASMTQEQRKHLEARLLEERERATTLLDRYAHEHQSEDEQDEAGDLSNMPLHMADQGTDTMRQELEAVMADRESASLTEIDAALQRLYEHPETFGICEKTNKEIPFARLDIVPWARTC